MLLKHNNFIFLIPNFQAVFGFPLSLLKSFAKTCNFFFFVFVFFCFLSSLPVDSVSEFSSSTASVLLFKTFATELERLSFSLSLLLFEKRAPEPSVPFLVWLEFRVVENERDLGRDVLPTVSKLDLPYTVSNISCLEPDKPSTFGPTGDLKIHETFYLKAEV